MKLYFKAGACSLSPHIVLQESGLAFEKESVDLTAKKTASGDDYLAINPKGYVPALRMDNGEVLTEGPAIVQYLADLVPDKRLAPPAGTLARYRLQEWLNFISTELHKSFSPLFNAKASDDWKNATRALLDKRIAFVARELEGKAYLMGDTFTVADAYLYTVLSWSKWVKVDLSRWAVIEAYLARIGERPAVMAALEAEKAAKTQ